MSWTTAVTDLRTHIADGATDKLSYRKKVIGNLNGINKTFKTFDFRRLTDFTTAVAPVGVYVDGTLASVTTDDVVSGEFVLVTAPTDGQTLEATYYIQWFEDTELTTFLAQSSQWAAQGSDFTVVPLGLQPAVIEYSAALSYRRLALFWSRSVSEQFMMQDAPQKDRYAIVDSYTKLADGFEKRAITLRNDYFGRQGQFESPLFGTNAGSVRDVPPNR